MPSSTRIAEVSSIQVLATAQFLPNDDDVRKSTGKWPRGAPAAWVRPSQKWVDTANRRIDLVDAGAMDVHDWDTVRKRAREQTELDKQLWFDLSLNRSRGRRGITLCAAAVDEYENAIKLYANQFALNAITFESGFDIILRRVVDHTGHHQIIDARDIDTRLSYILMRRFPFQVYYRTFKENDYGPTANG